MIKTFLEIILYVDGIILIELPYDLEFGDGGYAMNYFDLLPLENIIKARFVFKNVEPIETEARDAKHLHIFRILAAIYLARGSNKNAARLLGISPRMLCYRRGQFLDVHKWEKLGIDADTLKEYQHVLEIRRWTKLAVDKVTLKKLMHKHRSIVKVGDILGCSPTTLIAYARKMGYSLRNFKK